MNYSNFFAVLMMLVLSNCKNEDILPICIEPNTIQSNLLTTSTTFGYLKNFKGYIENVSQAQQCSKRTGRKILFFFTGLTFSSPPKAWAPLQNEEVKKLIDDSYILCILFCDNPQKLDSSEYYYSAVTKDTIKTLGRKNLDLQATKFRSNTQPMYIISDRELVQIDQKIGFMNNDFKPLISALKKKKPSLSK